MRLENDIMTDGAWEYLVTHKFGTVGFYSIFGC